MTADRLEEIIDEAGFDTMEYSGRGMYGASCVAFNVDAELSLGAVAEIVASVDDEEQEQVVRLFASAKQDNMGRDNIVIYFPKMRIAERVGA